MENPFFKGKIVSISDNFSAKKKFKFSFLKIYKLNFRNLRITS